VKAPLLLAILALPAALQAQTLPGSPELDDTQLKPGSWEIDITMKRGEQTIRAGTTRYELARVGESHWRLVSVTESQVGTAADTTLVETGTLLPVSHRSHAVPRTLSLSFHGTRVTGAYTPRDSAARAIDRVTEVPTFDAAFMEIVLGALPLAPGYITRLPLFIEERGGLTWAEVKVSGQRQLADVAAWEVRVGLAGYDVTYLLAREGRLPLGGKVHYPNGTVVEMTRTGG
jgi:hypothetical protein